MNATQALEAAMRAGREDGGFQRALDYQHELIGNAASQGRREVILAVSDSKPCYEAVKDRLLEEGFRIEWKRKFMGCWQDPAEYVCW